MKAAPRLFYHFTSVKFLEDIKREGITKGAIPVLSPSGLFHRKTGYQWLTESKEFDQSWCKEKELLDFSRNDYRLKIKLPNYCNKKLTSWIIYSERNRARNTLIKNMNIMGDPQNWWIFKGDISSKFIVDIKENPLITENFKP